MDYKICIERLRVKFERIGINPNEAFYPPLKDSEICTFEKQYRITLPEDYRLFLKEIGNGRNHNVRIYNWESSLNLLPLHETIFREVKPYLPFPFTLEKPDRNSFLDPHPNGYINGGFNKPMHKGYLAVSSQGCCLYVVLVVTGEARGQTWIYGEYNIFECLGNASWEEWDKGKRPCSFLEWFEGWLDCDFKNKYYPDL